VQELAEIAYAAIPCGIAAEASADFAAVVAKTAKITGTAADQIIGSLDTVMDAYGMATEEAAHVSGMLFKAAKIGGISFEEMGTGMRNVIPVAAQYGVVAEDVFASVAALATEGFTTRDAMKYLGDSISAVTHPSKNAAALAQRLGLDFSEAAVRSKGWAGFLDDLRKKTGGNIQIMEALFGNEKVARSMSRLVTSGAEAFSEALSEMGNAMNTIDEQFAKVTDTPAERWKKAINKIQNAGISLGTSLLPIVERVIGKVTEIADRIAAIDFSRYIGTVEEAIGVIEWFAGVVAGAIKIVWQFRYVIAAIAGPILLYNSWLMTVALTTMIFGRWQKIASTSVKIFKGTILLTKKAIDGLRKGTILHTIATKFFAIGTKTATRAQWKFNAAAAANPIVLIISAAIVAIIALIALTAYLKRNWNKVTDAVKKHSNKVLALSGPYASMAKEVVSNSDRIKEALAATGLFDKTKEALDEIKRWFVFIGGVIMGVLNAVKEKIIDVFNGIRTAFMTTMGPAINMIKGVFDAVYNFIKPALDLFSEKWRQITALFEDNAIVNAIKVIGGTLLSGLLIPIQGLLEILSYIPGLGHLAGKGAEKIEEVRNFLKGIDGATVSADVNVPDEAAEKLTPSAATGIPASPYDVPGFDIPGVWGRSKLHGVVDISGGAAGIPALGGIPGTWTATSAVSTPEVRDTIPQALLSIDRAMQSILAVVKNIDATTTVISSALPALRTGQREREEADREDPRRIPPVNREDRMAYSLQERWDTVGIEVSAAQGSQARIVRQPRSPNIRLTTSGGNT
jgi:TP901 family phage tail tape measure protein